VADFQLVSEFDPTGDQPRAIQELTERYQQGAKYQTLMGVTGSGKTFTMANVIQALKLPTLIISHNKTLAAQLYGELKDFFPHNAVEYFVSYYNYYQPEAYIPQRDIYIEKDASINEDIDRLRMSASNALLSREDVIIIATVSCIYGLGSPVDYRRMLVCVERGATLERDKLLADLVGIQYQRNDVEFKRGTFRVRGDVVEIIPTYEELAYRVEFFGDEVESLVEVNPLTGELLREFDKLTLWPAKHYVMPEDRLRVACADIREELEGHLPVLRRQNKLLEAQRLEQRTLNDLEMLETVGRCRGIENYSLHLTGRKPGDRPYCLLDYFPKPFLAIVDESHVTLPQIRGMFFGDKARKETLIEHGFRLPSAQDNRPLNFDEWNEMTGALTAYVSATPADYELERCGGVVVEQMIRPTGLLDPLIEVVPATGQIEHLMGQIRERTALGERVLVTTVTKRLAEDVSHYLSDEGFNSRFIHSELDAIERVEVLRDLRAGEFDVLVGVNLLREGLDLPEVSMVAILDADKEGFLRSQTSLVQTIGRAARHVNAKVILYAERITDSMRHAIDETERRRAHQAAYNLEHGITPKSIKKAIKQGIEYQIRAHSVVRQVLSVGEGESGYDREMLAALEEEMFKAAENLEFEKAAALRDRILEWRGQARDAGQPAAPAKRKKRGRRR